MTPAASNVLAWLVECMYLAKCPKWTLTSPRGVCILPRSAEVPRGELKTKI